MIGFDQIKTIGKVLQEAGKIEQYKQILEVQEQLLAFQKRIIELERENSGLKESLETKKKLEYKNNSYWTKEGEKDVGPFCSHCWEADHKLIRMHPDGNPAFSSCPHCKNSVQTDPSWHPPYTPRMRPYNDSAK